LNFLKDAKEEGKFDFKQYLNMFIAFTGENPYIVLASGSLGIIIPIILCLMVPSTATAPTTAPTATTQTVGEKKEEKTEEKEAKGEEEEDKKSGVAKRRVRKETD
jgi:hypothetical protein